MLKNGNPSGPGGPGTGRPTDRFRHLCQRALEEDNQLEILRKISKGLRSGKKDPAVKDQLRAIEMILDRALGKADQFIDMKVEGSVERPEPARVDAALRSVESSQNGNGVDTGK